MKFLGYFEEDYIDWKVQVVMGRFSPELFDCTTHTVTLSALHSTVHAKCCKSEAIPPPSLVHVPAFAIRLNLDDSNDPANLNSPSEFHQQNPLSCSCYGEGTL